MTNGVNTRAEAAYERVPKPRRRIVIVIDVMSVMSDVATMICKPVDTRCTMHDAR